MNKLSELAKSFQANVEAYISALDDAYQQQRKHAVAFLATLREEDQPSLPLERQPPQTRSMQLKGPNSLGINQPMTNTDHVEALIHFMNRPHFSVLDIRNELRASKSPLTDRQIHTAFRKIIGRKNSPLEKIRNGKGTIPSLFRLKQLNALPVGANEERDQPQQEITM